MATTSITSITSTTPFKKKFALLIIILSTAGSAFCSESGAEKLSQGPITTLNALKNFEKLKEEEFTPLVSLIKPSELIPLAHYLVQNLRLTFTKLAHITYILRENTETTCFQTSLKTTLNVIQAIEQSLPSPETARVLCIFEKQLLDSSGFNCHQLIKNLRIQGLYSELYQKYFALLKQAEFILFEKNNPSIKKNGNQKLGGQLSNFWALLSAIYSTIDYPAFPISCDVILRTPALNFSAEKYNLNYIKKNFFDLIKLERFEEQMQKVEKTITPEEREFLKQFVLFSKEVKNKREFKDAIKYESLINDSALRFLEKIHLHLALYSTLLKTIGNRASELSLEDEKILKEIVSLNQDLLSIRNILVYSPNAKKLSNLTDDLMTLVGESFIKISLTPQNSSINSPLQETQSIENEAPCKHHPTLMQKVRQVNPGLYLIINDIAPFEQDVENGKSWGLLIKSIEPFIENILQLNQTIVLQEGKAIKENPKELKLPVRILNEFLHNSIQFPLKMSFPGLQVINNIFHARTQFSLFCGYLVPEDPLRYPNVLPCIPRRSFQNLIDKNNKEIYPEFSARITRFLFKSSPNAFSAVQKEHISPQFCDFLGIDYSTLPSDALVLFCRGGFVLGDSSFLVFNCCEGIKRLSPLQIKNLAATLNPDPETFFEGTFIITEDSYTNGEKILPQFLFNPSISPWFPLRSLMGSAQKKKISTALKRVLNWKSKETRLFEEFCKKGASLSESDRAFAILKAAKGLRMSFLLPLLNEFVKTSQAETPEIDAAITSTLSNVENELNPSNEAKNLCKSLDEQIGEDLTCTPTMLADYLTLQKQLSNALKLHVGTLRKLGKDLFITIPVPSRFTILNTQGAPADLSGFYSSFFLELNKRPFLCTPSAINRLNHDLKVQYHLDSPYSPFWFFTTNRLFGRIAELRARCLNKKTLTAYSLQKEDGVIQELVSQSDLKKQLDSLEKQCITAWQNEQKIIHLLNQLTLSEPLLNELTTHILSNGASYLTTYQAFFKAQLKQTNKKETIVTLNDILRFLNLRNLLACRSTAYMSNIKLITSNAEFLWENNNNAHQKTRSKSATWINEHEKRFDQCLPLIDEMKRSFKHKIPVNTSPINFAKTFNHLKSEYQTLFEPLSIQPNKAN